MNILVLFYEFADYMLACYEELAIQLNCNVIIVKYPVNKEAPFQFNSKNPAISFYDKPDIENLLKFSKEINPSLLIVCGWKDKQYQEVADFFSTKIKVVLAFDNKWKGTFKQQIGRLYSRAVLKNRFHYCFVPNIEQEKFALKLGFNNQKIIKGLYCCNYEIFNSFSKGFDEIRKQNKNKTFLYVGRYYDYKGILEIWKAFIDLSNEIEHDWQLMCIGTGDEKPVEHDKIKHIGFVQPSDLPKYLSQASVFVMPSRRDAWGVALHEMTTCGFPVIVSDQVGAIVQFFEEGKNGYSFKTPNTDELKNCMKKMINLSNEEIFQMGNYSKKLASTLTPAIWASRLAKLVD